MEQQEPTTDEVLVGDTNETQSTPQTEGSRLRQERDKMKQERDAFREELLGVRLNELGLSPREGLGVAVMDSYDGVPTAEALTSYVQEKYRYEPPTKVDSERVTEPAERIAQVNEQSESVIPEPPVDQVADADARMHDPEAGREDAQQALAAKMQRYRQLRSGFPTT